MYHIHFISLFYGLLIDVKYVKIIWIDTIRGCSEFENFIFFIYFFNTDISFNIPLICLKFSTHADAGHLEGYWEIVQIIVSRIWLGREKNDHIYIMSYIVC